MCIRDRQKTVWVKEDLVLQEKEVSVGTTVNSQVEILEGVGENEDVYKRQAKSFIKSCPVSPGQRIVAFYGYRY